MGSTACCTQRCWQRMAYVATGGSTTAIAGVRAARERKPTAEVPPESRDTVVMTSLPRLTPSIYHPTNQRELYRRATSYELVVQGVGRTSCRSWCQPRLLPDFRNTLA
jgi:hypothetical protein